MSAARVAVAGVAESDADRAVTAMYGAQYGSLVRLAALLVGDVPAAEELVQDSFVAMHGSWGRLRNHDKALSYLRRSVVSRSRSVLPHLALPHPALPDPGVERPALPHAALPHATLPDEGAGQRDGAAMAAAVRALPARQREALVLRFYLDLPEAQIAAVLGISRRAVQDHTAGGMAALRGRRHSPAG
jgi:DNA-directed RNA polymerase specialized sigma24 family protein